MNVPINYVTAVLVINGDAVDLSTGLCLLVRKLTQEPVFNESDTYKGM